MKTSTERLTIEDIKADAGLIQESLEYISEDFSNILSDHEEAIRATLLTGDFQRIETALFVLSRLANVHLANLDRAAEEKEAVA